jgi:transcription elongation factor GreB
MGRYRPPTPKGSAYITAEGAAALRAELHQLWKVERPQVTAAVHEAAKNGDRSENGDSWLSTLNPYYLAHINHL